MSDEPHRLTPAEQQAWRSFIRLQQKLSVALGRDLQAHARLSGADFEILGALTEVAEGRQRFQELARAIDWEQSRLSHQIARMTKRGLVAREDCPDDGRGAFVVITPVGRETIEAVAPHHVDTIRRLVIDPIGPRGLATLGRLSNRILRQIDEVAP
jgi:DNA-binding MarR family transcriptional regulator